MNYPYKIFVALLLGLLFIIPFYPRFGRPDIKAEPVDSVQRLTLLFAGDVMQHKAQIDAAYDVATNTYQYDSCFRYVSSLISSYDIAFANLECTLGGPPYRGYPQFSAPDNIAVALSNAGFDYVVNANNHSCDNGKKGIERTIHVLDSIGLPHTGTFLDSAERAMKYPLIIKKNGIKIALLNYTYGTNGINVTSPNCVNLIDTAVIGQDLKRAADCVPDKTIVFIHWGDEYQLHPNQYQSMIAGFCLAHGADIIIGSHPHVLQKMERYQYPDSSGREVMVVYSLGNYISNQRDRNKDGGATVGLELIKRNGQTEIGLAGYYLTWVWIKQTPERKQYYIVPVSKYAAMIDSTDQPSADKMRTFMCDSRALYGSENCNMPEFIYDIKTDTWK
jgi:poly-gamma-glutamate capsule biosynthesis protein CapA/YwtB (metallophosphatase superfamily)